MPRVAGPSDTWNFYTLVDALRRRAKLVVACVVLVPAVAVGLSLNQEKRYTASAAMLFRDAGFDQQLFGAPVLQGSTDPDREAATDVRLVGLSTVADRTARRMGLTGLEVRRDVRVTAEGNSNVADISATRPTAFQAARLANAYALEYIAFRRRADQRKIEAAATLVRSELAALETDSVADRTRRSRLQQRREQLQILAALQTGNAELVQAAGPPSSPSSPQTVRNGILGGLLGVLLGGSLALVLDRIDRRLRDPEDAQDIFQRPILGHVPESDSFRRQARGRGLTGAAAEAFRMLRTSLLYFNVDRDITSLLVTSVAPGEGKSTVAWNLASAAAAGGSDVLLIEADLRRPSLPAPIDESGVGTGLSQILAGEVAPEDAVVTVPVEPGDDGERGPRVSVIFAGPIPPNPGDLLESKRMRSLVEESERRYDLVVIDSPPTYVVPDAVPLVKQVSGVIVVLRLGVASRDAARQLRDQLENLDAPTLGIVVNGVEQWRERYSYAYSEAAGFAGRTGRKRRGGRRARRRRARAQSSA